jgi:cadmium resistance protein CadD (predicted permease)
LFLKNIASSQRAGSDLWKIALITFSNGGDNIGIYTPLFAVSDAKRVFTFIAIFYVLIAIWCAVGYLLTRHRVVAIGMQKYGYRIVPFVFIGIGLYILLG